jgi:quercetin dioxygenase-like cupin family protein
LEKTMATKSQIDPRQPFMIMQDVVRMHVRREETAGAFFVIEVDVAPGGGPPPLHTHDAAELFWALRGNLTEFLLEAAVEVGGPAANPG